MSDTPGMKSIEMHDYSVQVDRTSESEWSALLDQFDDASLYQTWAYGAVRWGDSRVSRLVLRRRGEPVAMAQVLVLRPLPLRLGMAQLRWGPVCERKGSKLDLEVVEATMAALHREYVQEQGLLLRVMPHARLDSAQAAAFRHAHGKFTEEEFRAGESYRTMLVDLTPPLEIIRKRLDQKWRNQLNRAEKNGLTVTEDDGVAGFAVFFTLYEQMLARKRFGSSDVSHFRHLQERLSANHRMRVFICLNQDEPVAATIASAIGCTGVYLLGATNEKGMQCKAAYLLQWRMIQWLQERGASSYDLGGVNPESNPGVYHFKKGISGEDILYAKPMVACDRPGSRTLAASVAIARDRGRTARSLISGWMTRR